MAKTFIQLINEVGKNTRLSTGSTYSALDTDADEIFIQQMINEAKRMVEGERQWHVLRDTITFDLAASTFTYDLSDLTVVTSDPTVTNDRSQLIETENGLDLIYDVTDTTAYRLCRKSRNWVVDRRRMDNTATTWEKPYYCAVYPSGDGLTFEVPYAPTGVRNMSLDVYTPQDDLAATDTELTCPYRPVVLAATALIAEERGEELGLDASTWWERYDSALSEAIIVDMLIDTEAVLVPV